MTINVFSNVRLRRTVAASLALAGAGLLFFLGYRAINSVGESISEGRALSAKKDEGMRRLERRISDLDYEGALKIADELKDSNIYETDEVDGINARVKSISEDVLYRAILVSQDKKNLSERFLSAYPNSPHKKEVIDEMLAGESFKLYRKFIDSKPYAEVFSSLKDLEFLLEKYPDTDKSGLQIGKVYDEGAKYIEIKSQKPAGVSIGTYVKVGETKPEGWNSYYFNDREAVIFRGTRGYINKIVERNEEDISKNKYEVYFGDIKSNSSIHQHSGSTSDVRGTWTPYYGYELETIPAVDAFQANEFKACLDRIKSKYSVPEIEETIGESK